MTYPKKLIEVALPLEAINKESAREKSIRHGHPSTLHLWWARRPLAAARAVLFSSLVDDPSEYIDNEEEQKKERERLFQLIEELVKWENINNDEVLDKAKLEIARSVARNLGEPMPIGKKAIEEFLDTKAPPVLDPFAGGGTIPLEAQRLGLRAYASDLNPVAVLINKALIEIPPQFANMPPIHPSRRKEIGDMDDMFEKKEWENADGLAEDVIYYGQILMGHVHDKIGKYFPNIILSDQHFINHPELAKWGYKKGSELNIIAWVWTRTVICENPLCKCEVPLARSFKLATKKGKEAWIKPCVNLNNKSVKYTVQYGRSNNTKGIITKGGGRCIICNSPLSFEYIRDQGKRGLLGYRMMAIVCEGNGRRIYLNPTDDQQAIANSVHPSWIPSTELPEKALGFRVQSYGMNKHAELFSQRQLLVLSTFTEQIRSLRKEIILDIFKNPNLSIENDKAHKYVDAIVTYLAFTLDRMSQQCSTLATWSSNPAHELVVNMFSRQTLAMTWDFGEINPFSNAAGWLKSLDYVAKVIRNSVTNAPKAKVKLANAMSKSTYEEAGICAVSTDPPYYDNIGYADLSDYFYIWLRKALFDVYPDILGTLLVPKAEELIASPFRFGGNKLKAKTFFEEGLFLTFNNIRKIQHSSIPFTVFYAFRQTEVDNGENAASTGWETMLEGLLRSGFLITGTWPVRTERDSRMLARGGGGTNALASSIVLVCRPKADITKTVSRRDFIYELKENLKISIPKLQQGHIAPVDLAQAAIGPGMAIFSRYQKVLEADGNQMSVRSALATINQVLDEVLAEQEVNYDEDTRWSLSWYEQYGHVQAPFGIAETLSKAKNTSIQGLVEAGILESRSGHVRLLRRDELDENWTQEKDKQLTIWEATQYLIRTLDKKGEQAAAELLKRLGSKAEPARDLAYRLYTICERKGWAQDALGYNMLVVAWPRLKELASKISSETQNSFL